MNPVRPQNTPESPTLLNDLKAEVRAESAPLLQFIVRHSGLIVGVVETIGASYISSGYRDAIAFLILILVLLIKPSGILGKQKIEKM